MNIETILQENFLLKQEIQQLKEHLKKYTAPKRNILYYENHKEDLLKKMKDNPISPEKRKEYNKISYQRRKEKKMKEQQNINI